MKPILGTQWSFLDSFHPKLLYFLDKKLTKMTTVSSQNILKINRTPAFSGADLVSILKKIKTMNPCHRFPK